MHGYELARLVRADDALRAIWHLERSEVYFLLKKLLDKGHIEEVVDSKPPAVSTRRQAGGPPRRIYQVTVAGRAAVDAWMTTPVSSPRDLRAAFLTKLYLAMRRDPETALALLDRQRQVLAHWQERLSRAATSDPFLASVHRLRLAQVVASLNALDDMQAMLATLLDSQRV